MSKIIRLLQTKASKREREQDIVLGRKIPESREKDFVSYFHLHFHPSIKLIVLAGS